MFETNTKVLNGSFLNKHLYFTSQPYILIHMFPAILFSYLSAIKNILE